MKLLISYDNQFYTFEVNIRSFYTYFIQVQGNVSFTDHLDT
jgi:hypothetical protein